MQKSPFSVNFTLMWDERRPSTGWKLCHLLRIWQYWKSNLKVNIMKSHPACVSSRRTKGKFDFYIADRFLSDFGSDVARKEKSRSSSLKISPVRMKTCRVMKTASKSKHKWGQTCACLVATRWPCVTLGLIAFHGGAHTTLSSWGAEAPAVTHHQQRNITAKRSTQK